VCRGNHVIVLIDDPDIRVLDHTTGQLIRKLTLDYQALGIKCGTHPKISCPRKTMSRDICQRCLGTRQRHRSQDLTHHRGRIRAELLTMAAVAYYSGEDTVRAGMALTANSVKSASFHASSRNTLSDRNAVHRRAITKHHPHEQGRCSRLSREDAH